MLFLLPTLHSRYILNLSGYCYWNNVHRHQLRLQKYKMMHIYTTKRCRITRNYEKMA